MPVTCHGGHKTATEERKGVTWLQMYLHFLRLQLDEVDELFALFSHAVPESALQTRTRQLRNFVINEPALTNIRDHFGLSGIQLRLQPVLKQNKKRSDKKNTQREKN